MHLAKAGFPPPKRAFLHNRVEKNAHTKYTFAMFYSVKKAFVSAAIKVAFTAFVFASLLAAASCASTKNSGTKLNKVYVTNTKKVSLLPADAIKIPQEYYEYFTGTFNGTTFASLCYLDAGENGISVVLLNEFGMEMGTLIYDGNTASLNSSLFPKSLKSEYIILDLQNIFCSAEELLLHYKNYGLDFSERALDDKTVVRELFNKKDLIEKITVTLNEEGARCTRLENLLRGYVFEFTEVSDE